MHTTEYRLDPVSVPSPDRPPRRLIEKLKRKIEQKKMQKFDKELKKRLTGMAVIAIFFIAALTISCLFASKEVNSKEVRKETKEIIEYSPSYGKVTFTHKKHSEDYKIDCLKCHHTWKKGETSDKLCKDCHKAKTEGKTISAKEAFHKNCKGCHEELKKADKATGPTGCTQCHIKIAK